MFKKFIGAVKKYARNNRGSNVYGEIKEFINWTQYLTKHEQDMFMEYALEYWKVYAMDVLNKEYVYIAYTSLVMQGFIDWRAKL